MPISSKRRKALKINFRLLGFFFLIFSIPPLASAQNYEPSREDIQFLDLVQKKSFDFFRKEHHPVTGLVKDKANNFQKDSSTISSIAATGFGLAAMTVGARRGWISKDEAQSYCLKTLNFFWSNMQTEHGFFYHFVNWETGKRVNRSEVSSIDTALFLAGALTAGEFFKGTEVEELAKKIYERVDFPWMLNGGDTLAMGWDPQQGFQKPRWEQYNESLILYILAIGSPTHPLAPESWYHVNKRIGVYGPYVLIYSPPLFTHQYSQIWLDLRNKHDGFANYFENSRIATLVNRQFCLDQKRHFRTYSENVWGLTASLSPHSYKAYGSGPGGALHDGTVAPTAAGSSIVFTPGFSIPALRTMYKKHKQKIWGKYGFTDAFNLDKNWTAQEVLGIDQGPLLLMIENYRSEFLWKLFMQHPAILRGLDLGGFQTGTLSLKAPQRPTVLVEPAQEKIRIDGNLEEWKNTSPLTLHSPHHRELGEISSAEDLHGEIFLAWDSQYLYLAARITDDSLIAQKKTNKIWQNDLLEIYINPDGGGLQWGNPKDIQLGIGPSPSSREAQNWAWFQGFDPEARGLMKSRMRRREGGYDLEAKISWKFLKISPRPNLNFAFSPAIHDIDKDGSEGKLQWFYLPEGKSGKIFLGRALLK